METYSISELEKLIPEWVETRKDTPLYVHELRDFLSFISRKSGMEKHAKAHSNRILPFENKK